MAQINEFNISEIERQSSDGNAPYQNMSIEIIDSKTNLNYGRVTVNNENLKATALDMRAGDRVTFKVTPGTAGRTITIRQGQV